MEAVTWVRSLLTPETWSNVGAGIIGFAGAFIGVTFGAWLKSYFEAKGKNVATKQDLIDLQAQLSENTKLTRSIEANITREELLKNSELAFRQKQLSDLYGPIYSYLMSQRDITLLWQSGAMAEKNLDVKIMFAEQNKIMRDLIFKNAHLIEGTKMPGFFVQFFTNTIVWDMYASPTDQGALPKHLEDDERTRYSKEFDEHIISVTEKLKERIESLHKKYNFETDLSVSHNSKYSKN